MEDNTFTIGIVRGSLSVDTDLDPNEFYPIEYTYVGDEYSKNLERAMSECDELFIYSNNNGALPIGNLSLPVADDELTIARCAKYDSRQKLVDHILSFFDIDSSKIELRFRTYGSFPRCFVKITEQ